MRMIDADAFDSRVRAAGGFAEEELTEDFKDGVLTVLEMLKSQPSAEQEWIPCSERLPEEAGAYICSCKDGNRRMVTAVKWQPKLKSWNLSGARAYWKVLAWLPLPEPYQPKEDES